MERACTPTTSSAVIDIGGRNGISSSVPMCKCEVLCADTTTHVSHHAYKGNIATRESADIIHARHILCGVNGIPRCMYNTFFHSLFR